MKYDSTNYIDTLGLKQAVFFADGGYSIDLHSYANSKETTGNEYKFDTYINGQKATSPKIERQTTQFGGRLYKTPKAFVHQFGFHLQIKAPPALLRQQHSTHKTKMPIKCMMGIQIPSLLELRKSDAWDKFIVGRGTGSIDKDINNYILYCIPMDELKIVEWGDWTSKELGEMLKRDNDAAKGRCVEPINMDLVQVDFCVNTIDSNVSEFYNLLKHIGNYGTKNMKLYHNNIDRFDAEYTIGNYNDRGDVVLQTPSSILTKANGLEFRRGSKSSQVVKFYDYTLKARKYYYDNFIPIMVSNNNTKSIEHAQRYYGKTPKEISKRKTTMRYELSFRNIIGGTKGVYELFKKSYSTIEQKRITLIELFDVRYRKLIGRSMRKYLLDIFGDVITEDLVEIGENKMDKFDIIRDYKLSKGLQILAIIQLTEGDNGLSIAEIKKKLLESGASYESIRRIMKIVKEEGYASNWNTDRIVAMNCIKELYKELDKVE